jgi:hypothetical protein
MPAVKDQNGKRIEAHEAALRAIIAKLAASNSKWKPSDVTEVEALLDAGK